MKMTRRVGAFNIDLLSSKLQERFRSLLSVAEKRTIFSWTEAPVRGAQVVFFEDSRTLPAELPAFLALVGSSGDALEVRAMNKDAFHLEFDFRVTQLADLLDRAAVRLLDLRGAPAASASAAASETTRTESFKLRRWIVLAQPFNSQRYMSAMALISREAMTLDTLCTHTGLLPEEVRELMAELAKHDAVTSTFAEVSSAPVAVAAKLSHAAHGGEKRADGLFNKLTRWLTQSRGVPAKTAQ